MDVAENVEGPPRNQEKRCRADDRHFAFDTDKEVVKEHAQWRNPELKSRLDATQSSVIGAMNAAISAWVAEE